MGNELRCGDCLDILPTLPARSIDVVVTSPPQRLAGVDPAYDDRGQETAYLDWMVQVAQELSRVLRPDGSVFLNMSGSSTQPFLPFELVVRWRRFFALQNHIVWVKALAVGEAIGAVKPIPGKRFLNRNHEHVFHLTLHGDVRIDRLAVGVPSGAARRGKDAADGARGLRCRGDTWFIPYRTPEGAGEAFNNPGTVPLDLPRWCIRLHGKAAASVLDPFAGAGTTILAAAAEGCVGLGIEIDADHVATARARLAAMPASLLRDLPTAPVPPPISPPLVAPP